MKKYVWIILMGILIFTFYGCENNDDPVVSENSTQTANVENYEKVSTVKTTEPPFSSDSKKIENEVVTTIKKSSESPKETVKITTIATKAPETRETQSKATEKQVQKENKPIEQADNENEPVECLNIPETQPDLSPEPETITEIKSEPTPQTETEPPVNEPVEPAFNIDELIAYAQGYASNVGLRLESSAVECWDNPITAGIYSQYIERYSEQT